MKARLLEDAPLFGDRDAAAILRTIARGTELEVGVLSRVKGADWAEVILPEGQKGFLPGTAKLLALQDVVLDQDEATLREKPQADARAKGTLAKNEPLVILEITPAAAGEPGPGWSQVRHPKFGEGFLPANTKIRPAGTPEMTYARSFITWAKIFGGISALGALLLGVLMRDWTGGLVLLGTCILTGGVAGLVHFATTRMREKEYGPHIAWVLVIATYLITTGGVLGALMPLSGARTAAGLANLWEPSLLSSLVGGAIALGLLLGLQEQRQQHVDEGRAWRVAHVLAPLLGGAGAAGALIGLIWFLHVEHQSPLVHEASQPEQVLTLKQLSDRGYGDNRYLLLTEFRHADRWIIDDIKEGNSNRLDGWLILTPGKFAGPKASAKTPRKVRALVRTNAFDAEKKATLGPRPLEWNLSHTMYERTGLTVMVMNGMERLSGRAREAIRELAPDTDVNEIYLLSRDVKPGDPTEWAERRDFWLLVLGGGGALAGLALVLGKWG